LHQKRADLRLVGTPAGDIDDIGGFDVGGFDWLTVDQANQRPQHEIDADDEGCGEDGVAPSETSVLVRNPARRCRHWRSKPMTPPSSKAVIRSSASFSNAGSNIGGIGYSPSPAFASRLIIETHFKDRDPVH
jgi:hypothetical protein